jgi:hypothetical protein
VGVDRGSCVVLDSVFVVVDRGPCVVLEQWLCCSGSRSMLGTRAVAVWKLISVRAWDFSVAALF